MRCRRRRSPPLEPLAFLGNVARDRGDYESAAAWHRDAGDLYDRLGHDRGSAWSRFDLGRSDWQSGQTDAAVVLFREALERFRSLDYPWAVAWSSWALGTLLIESGMTPTAARRWPLP